MAADWTPPAQIDELRLERPLGRGGMGAVWLARDTLLDRDVAVKFGDMTSDEERLRARVEARAIARLAHPNILRIHHVREVEDRTMLVTEVLSGLSLDRVDKPMPAERAIAVGIDLARGLAAAHAAGVLHRDIKPANAFLCDDGTAKLLDFGLAQLVDAEASDPFAATSVSTTRSFSGELDATSPLAASSGGATGTPLYMAPEAWRGHRATPRSDVYGLGALLLELLSGRPPYPGDTLLQVGAGVLSGRPPEAVAALAAPLRDLLLRCLHPRPEQRPSATQVVRALEDLVAPAGRDAAPSLPPGMNPYRGLLAFGPEHRAVFFGRSREAAAVLDALRAAPFVLVAGASGAGKSSLVRAGVIPRVTAGALGPGDWRVAVMVPAGHPLERLAQALAAALRIEEGPLLERLLDAPGDVRDVVSGALEASGRLVLFVDQLEEAWALSRLAQRAALLDAITALSRMGAAVRVVATLRADFLDRTEGPPFGGRPILVGPMSPDGLRDAIARPAAAQGVTLAPAVVEALVAETGTGSARGDGDAAGALPLLEFALASLWERRDPARDALDLSDLAGIGGLAGALAAHADATIARMGSERRAEARRLLLALVTEERTRARREEGELALDRPEARPALDALVAARLVVASVGDVTASYGIAHEAILSGWPPLGAWVDESAETRANKARLERAAAEWERLGRGAEGLIDAARLRAIDAAAIEELPPAVRDLIEQSRRAAARRRRRAVASRVSVPALLVAAGLATWGAASHRQRAALTAILSEARALDALTQETSRQAADLRESALALFDRDDPTPAEDLWKRSLAREADLDAQRQRVLATVERAIALDPTQAAARAIAADTTLARLLAAERLHGDALLDSLRGRLGAYDDGSRAAWLVRPGHVRFETDPPGAALVVTRYRDRGDGRLVDGDPTPLEAGAIRELEPGSYLAVAQLPGRYATRYPFVVGRGEALTVRVQLPPAEDVPRGMIYVPSGRCSYGSGDDEATRGFLLHQPMRTIEVPAFLVARFETTWGEYLAYLRAAPPGEREAHRPPVLTLGADGKATWRLRSSELAEGADYCAPGRACVDWRRLPVDDVSQDDGEAYARWLTASGVLRGARLCTDREWERAARGADARRFPWGDTDAEPADACSLATFGGETARAGPCEPGSHPQGRTVFGVDDASGNVWEWTGGHADVGQPEMAVTRSSGYDDPAGLLALENRASSGRRDRARTWGLRVCASPP